MDIRSHYIEKFALHNYLNADLLRCLRLFELPPHRDLYVQQHELTLLYFLVDGKVQVGHDHPNGKQAVLAMLTPLAVIGDLEVFGFEDIHTNLRTLEKTTLLGLEKTFVLRFGYEDPQFLRFIIHHVITKLYHSSNIQVGHALPLINQVAAYLLDKRESDIVILPSKLHLAGLFGTTSRHLNRVIKQLKVDGIIRVENRSVHILNLAQLEMYSQS